MTVVHVNPSPSSGGHQSKVDISDRPTPSNVVVITFNALLKFLNFPVLGDIERPLELQVRMIIIVNELGDSFIVPSCHHSGRSLVLGDCG